MLDVLFYVVGAIAFIFFVYQTVMLIKQLISSFKQGYKKPAIIFTFALIAVLLIYIGIMIFLFNNT